MREVTVSKGYLRCGECMQVFDSSESLSTTMQKPYIDKVVENKVKTKKISAESLQTISVLDDWQNSTIDDSVSPFNFRTKKDETNNIDAYKDSANPFTIKGTETHILKDITKLKAMWPLIAVGLLSLLLITQIVFNFKHIFSDAPRYEPEKIHMLNHNVFAHPIDKGVLLISASIENTADFDQPFPTLEVRLTNSKSDLVALRRFTPYEYLDNFTENKLLTKNRATSIKLKIQDPGNQATRFQFDFL